MEVPVRGVSSAEVYDVPVGVVRAYCRITRRERQLKEGGR
jgi:hypothetical protein